MATTAEIEPVPWPPFGIVPLFPEGPQGATPHIAELTPNAANGERDMLGHWPLEIIMAEIVLRLVAWERTNPKAGAPAPPEEKEAYAASMREARTLLFREGEALTEAGTTRDLNEYIAYGLWAVDEIYQQVGRMKARFPFLAHWPTRAALWRLIEGVFEGEAAWMRNEKKRTERIRRFAARLKPEAKCGLVATAIRGAIEASSKRAQPVVPPPDTGAVH